ncbi:MAG: glycosyl hydrolase [Tepidisphaeraceae bacterium]|jgi:hypothetical protein
MGRWTFCATALLTACVALGQTTDQRITPAIKMPKVSEVAANFAQPPSEYGAALWWGWGGPMDDAAIARDLDTIKRMGFTVACVEADNGVTSTYLSPAWFHLVRTACTEAKKRDMKLWFEDEAKYPSGFAGGRFTAERPDLGMQVLSFVPETTVTAAGGATVTRDLSPDIVGALATNDANGDAMPIDVSAGKLNWTAPAGDWTIRFIRHEYKTSPTRSVNNPNRGAKDQSETLEDYLNPEATAKFIQWTHEQYKAAAGDQFGTTILGFTGDEPDFTIGNSIPWTNAVFDEFKSEKGYDVRPLVGELFVRNKTDEQRRVYADYWDVWSNMFRENFFRMQGDWCAANHVQYQLHINHEDMLMSLVQSEGDFFKCMRYVEMPGIDLIYHQMFDDNITDFPKLASSVADVFGRARSYTESFAAMQPVVPNVVQATWILNAQLVRGVNMDEIMWWTSPTTGGRGGYGAGTRPTTAPFGAASRPGRRGFTGARGPSFFTQPAFVPVAQYLHRASYVMSMGQPTAQIALYVPFTSMWFGDADAYADCLAISATLLQHQRDFDFIDEQALSSVLKLDGGKFTNLSGTSYQTVVIPSVDVISQASLDRLKTFAAAGGKVIFLGRLPSIVSDKTFRDATPPGDLSWAITENAPVVASPQPFVKAVVQMSDKILAALPAQVQLATPAPAVKYNHRHWSDGEVYFFFNESTTDRVDNSVTLSTSPESAANTSVQLWDASNGNIQSITPTARTTDSITVPLKIAPQSSAIIVIGPSGQ